MKLTAKVIETISGSNYDGGQPRIKLKVTEGDSCFRTFIVPNADGLALDDEVVLLTLQPHQVPVLLDVLNYLDNEKGLLPSSLKFVRDQLRPDPPPPFMAERCAVTCHSYNPKSCTEPHRCGLLAGHTGIHRFQLHGHPDAGRMSADGDPAGYGSPQPDTVDTQEFVREVGQ